MTNLRERQAVLAAAMLWQGTPFMWECCIRGVGCDCGRFIAGACNDSGVLPQIDIKKLPRMSPQFMCNRDDPDAFVRVIEQFAGEYTLDTHEKPKPADIVVVKTGRGWGHSALVIDWPRIIGAANGFVVTAWEDIYRSPQYGNRPMRLFDLWKHPRNV